MIKKIGISIVALLFLFIPFFGFSEGVVNADSLETVHFFEDSRCPDCARQKEYMEDVLLEEYPNLEIKTYEIGKRENQDLLKEMMEERDVEDYRMMVPTTFIGENYFQSFYEEDKELIKKAIEGENVMDEQRACYVDIPFVGEVCVETLPLPILAVILGSLDGLNVCSIGALILILMIVLSFDSRKKTVFYGSLFILTAVVIYGVLVFAWTALFQTIASFIGPLNTIIGIAALLGALFFLKEFIRFLKHGPTCQSTNSKLANKATQKVKSAFNNNASKTFVLITSVIFFAAVITIVELPCSFGLPMVYGGILAQAGLPWISYAFYIVLYLFFYMLIELVIFAGAVITKEVWIAQSNLITWVYLMGTLVLFFLSYYYLIGL